MKPVRLGIVGCGAVTELSHLPAARAAGVVQVVALADTDLARAQRLGRRFDVPHCVEDFRQFAGLVDAALVAVPHHVHAPIAGVLLEMKIPVLVEKPLATTVEECRSLTERARALGVPLQVGHMYRFSQATRLVKRVLDDGWLGPVREFSMEYGGVYNWPVTSGFFWHRAQAGGGALIDAGSHMLDLLLWWFGDVAHVEYRDDSRGGVEADCLVSLGFAGPAGEISGTLLVSRLRQLTSGARITGERFSLECRLHGRYEVRVWPSHWPDGAPAFASDFGPPGDSYRRLFVEQLRGFAAAVREGGEPFVPGEAGLKTVALIERCYRERQPLAAPWE